MKNISKIFALILMLLGMSQNMNAQTWSFATVSATDKTNLNEDKTNWTYESNNNRWLHQATITDAALTANGVELEFTKGLTFTTTGADQLRVDAKKQSMTINNKAASVKIHNAKKDQILTIEAQSSNSSTARQIEATNIEVTSGFAEGTSKATNVGKVLADGDIVLTVTGGMYIYSIKVADEGTEPEQPATETDYSVLSNTLKNQAILTLKNNSKKFYNTETLQSIDINNGNVTVSLDAEKSYTYQGTVADISFKKAEVNSGDIDNPDGAIVITEARGWLETAYIKFQKFEGAKTYNVYVKGGQYANYTKIDNELVRDYGTYGRADAMGLAAGSYSMKIVAVNESKEEIASSESVANNIAVKAFNRDGYAHYNATEGIGAYNNDGTLKSDARILYVTKSNAKTITLNMKVDKNEETRTGIQDIIQAYEKGTETRPLAIRIIGQLKKSDMPELGSSSIGLQVKGKGQKMNLTIEGVGNDATFHGFGVLVRNSQYIELRNFAVMMHPEDGISFDTDNEHLWGHHLDIFYGENKGGDKAKGDGSFDVKGTKYCTVSDNHFWDAGKCNLNSNGDEVDFVTYHHNWYDHSDSRHPRVRISNHLHVFNNYYDGNSKYGIGSTTGSCVFSENNYFRNCKNPMLISMQGTDTKMGTDEKDAPTFSKEDGGVIKAFGNILTGDYTFAPYSSTNSGQFDAYVAATRDEQVPASVIAKKGGTGYNNFDTASDFYEYTPDAAEDVPGIVTGQYGAGRCEKGDFQWAFNNETEDRNYAVIPELSNALKSYTNTSLIGIFGEDNGSSQGGNEGGEQGGEQGGKGGDVTPTPEGTIECWFENGAATNNFFTTEGSKKDYTGDKAITYNGKTYTQAWTCNSTGKINFTTTKAMNLTIALTTKRNDVGLDGTTYTSTGSGTGYYEVVINNVAAGSHSITKGSGETHPFYIKLEPTE